MRRFVWTAIIVFGAGIIALMAASLILQKQVEGEGVGPSDNLRTPVAGIAHAIRHWEDKRWADFTDDVHGLYLALTTWNRDVPAENAPDLPERAWQKMFDAVNTGNAEALRKRQTLLSALDTFPPTVFTGVTPHGVNVQYEVRLEGGSVWLRSEFVRREDRRDKGAEDAEDAEEGYFIRLFRCQIDDGGKVLTLKPAEKPLPLDETLERLFASLGGGTTEAFRKVMVFDAGVTEKEVSDRRDGIRKMVMACGDRRLAKLVPKMGPLPEGTKTFLISAWGTVPGEGGEKRIRMGFYVANEEPMKIIDFVAGTIEARAAAKRMQ